MTRFTKENVPCKCMMCGKITYGRADRKFCSEECKNHWHNEMSKKSRLNHNRILTALNHNYSLLQEALHMGKISIDLALIEERGFRPSLVTGYTKVRYGHDRYRCFDISYNSTPRRIFNLNREKD